MMVLRKLKPKCFRTHTKKLLRVLASNWRQCTDVQTSIVDIEVDEIECHQEQLNPLPTRVCDILEGVSLLLFHTCKGVKGCLHSDGGARLSVSLSFVLPVVCRSELEAILDAITSQYRQSLGQSVSDIKVRQQPQKKRVISQLRGIADSATNQKHALSSDVDAALSNKNYLNGAEADPRCVDIKMLPQNIQQFVLKVAGQDSEDLCQRNIAGRVMAECMRRLFRHVHPSNMAELWIRIAACLESIVLNWRVLTSLPRDTWPALEQHLIVSTFHFVEIVLFALRHSNGRGLSDSSVKRTVSKTIVESVLALCKSVFIYADIRRAQVVGSSSLGQSMTHLPSGVVHCLSRLVERVQLMFCQLWIRFPTNSIIISKVKSILPLVIDAQSANPAVLLLSQELLQILPLRVVQSNLVQPMISAVASMMKLFSDSSVNGESGAAGNVRWLEVLVKLLYRLGDPRDDGLGRSERPLVTDTVGSADKGPKAAQDEDMMWAVSSDEFDSEEERGTASQRQKPILHDTLPLFDSGAGGITHLLRNSVSELCEITERCVAMLQAVIDSAVTHSAIMDLTSDAIHFDSHIPLTFSSLCWFTTCFPDALSYSSTCEIQLQQLVNTSLKMLLQNRDQLFRYMQNSAINLAIIAHAARLVACCWKGIDAQTGLGEVVRTMSFLVTQRPSSLSLVWALLALLNVNLLRESGGVDDLKLCTVLSAEDSSALFQAAASALTTPSYWLRLSLLRLLSHFPCPVIETPHGPSSSKSGSGPASSVGRTGKVPDVIDDSSGGNVDVVGVCLEAARTPLELRSEREFARLFGQLESLVRFQRLPIAYVRLVCAFCLGMLNVKFMPVWEPAIVVLVAAAEKEDGEQEMWPLLLGVIESLSHKSVSCAASREGIDEWATSSLRTGSKLIDQSLGTESKMHREEATQRQDITVDNVDEAIDEDDEVPENEIMKPHAKNLSVLQDLLLSLDDGRNCIEITLSCSEIFFYNGDVANERELMVRPDARTDVEAAYNAVWNVLKRCPLLTLKRSKVVVPLFLR